MQPGTWHLGYQTCTVMLIYFKKDLEWRKLLSGGVAILNHMRAVTMQIILHRLLNLLCFVIMRLRVTWRDFKGVYASSYCFSPLKARESTVLYKLLGRKKFRLVSTYSGSIGTLHVTWNSSEVMNLQQIYTVKNFQKQGPTSAIVCRDPCSLFLCEAISNSAKGTLSELFWNSATSRNFKAMLQDDISFEAPLTKLTGKTLCANSLTEHC